MEATDTPKTTAEKEAARSTGTNATVVPMPVTPVQNGTTPATPPAPVLTETLKYSLIKPSETWPPPIFIDLAASDSERYYMEHRWYSQWSYYDKKASDAKKQYHRYQLFAVIGAGCVTALVGLSPIATNITVRNGLTVLTVLVSLLVTSATAIEAVQKFGDSWRNYRSAAEELKREKSLYDVRSGSYRKAKKPFLLFVERCEEIMAKQNGSWAALREEQQPQQSGAPAPASTAQRDVDADDLG
ncbi:MAG: DUF4231 domain-containing protein [bacterium]|nr:DUF4231 domain-containing protein [bacterium]